MAISTVRQDGWPQTTIVGYANRGFELVFLIYRSGQKLANIRHDNRISVAVAEEPRELNQLQAVYAGAHAEEITTEAGREQAWRLLMERHANLSGSQLPDATEAVFMRARCRYVSMLDFTQGLGHREQFAVDENGALLDVSSEKDGWNLAAASPELGPQDC